MTRIIALLALFTPGIVLGHDTAALDKEVERTYPRLQEIYESIHSHPELAFAEHRTSRLLAEEMRALGFAVTTGVAKTGVVAMLSNGPGPTVMVRTELDGLPMQEDTDVPYASRATTTWNGTETFVTHGCGHDIHMATWVGAAQALRSLQRRWRGTLMFVAEPAEEARAGAKAMLDDSLFTRFARPDYALALHTIPLAHGTVWYRSGPIMSSSNSLSIEFVGRGGHGSAPHMTIDPVTMAARFIVDVQSVISREKDPQRFGVISIGSIQGGSAGNIIPHAVSLRGTIRSYDPQTRDGIIEGIRRTAGAVAGMSGAPAPTIEIGANSSPMINDPELMRRIEPVFQTAFGDQAREISPLPASDDFAEFAATGVPSLYFLIGVHDPQWLAAETQAGRAVPSNHSPQFAPVPEPTIKTGVRAMTLAVLELLKPSE